MNFMHLERFCRFLEFLILKLEQFYSFMLLYFYGLSSFAVSCSSNFEVLAVFYIFRRCNFCNFMLFEQFYLCGLNLSVSAV